jgi:hypothetical protein
LITAIDFEATAAHAINVVCDLFLSMEARATQNFSLRHQRLKGKSKHKKSHELSANLHFKQRDTFL